MFESVNMKNFESLTERTKFKVLFGIQEDLTTLKTEDLTTLKKKT